MDDETVEKGAPAIQLVAQERTEGYCDPVTGVCVWPGAAKADTEAEQEDTREPSPTE
jgi:hypothetical protein